VHQIVHGMIPASDTVHAYIAFFAMHVASKAMLFVFLVEDDELLDWLQLHCCKKPIGRTLGLTQQAWLK
jgi:hypothetical protein